MSSNIFVTSLAANSAYVSAMTFVGKDDRMTLYVATHDLVAGGNAPNFIYSTCSIEARAGDDEDAPWVQIASLQLQDGTKAYALTAEPQAAHFYRVRCSGEMSAGTVDLSFMAR